MTVEPSPPNRTPYRGAAAVVASLAIDIVIGIGCYWLAHRLRFSSTESGSVPTAALRALPIVVASQMAAFALSGVYRTSLTLLWPRIVLGVIVGSAAGFALSAAVLGLQGLSRLSFLVDALLVIAAAFSWRGSALLWEISRGTGPGRVRDLTLEDRADRVRRARGGLVGLLRYQELLKNLVAKELKLKYRGSVLGFVWSLLNPLSMLIVYTVAFTYIMRVGDEGFVFRLLIGLLAWGFFAESAKMSTTSIIENRGLIKSVFFPRAILPVATVLFNLAQFLLSFVVFVPLLLLIYSVRPAPAMLAFPVFLVLQIAFIIGVTLTLSTATTFFRDIKHLLDVSLTMLFWATPIVYNLGSLPAGVRTSLLLSPMSAFVVAYQQMFYYRQWPDASVWVVAAGYAAVALISGSVIFVTYENRFAEQV